MRAVLNKRYGTLDGLRTIACIGIVLMHVMTNNTYSISDYWYVCVIPSFSDFVYLFMVISAFSMCCGYLEKIQKAAITPREFYLRRYRKVLPFFSTLVLIDVIFNYQEGALQEAFADLTLFHGFFANDIEVIGVGWFLGVLFAFYFLFPFYSVLLTNRITSVIALIIAVCFSVFCGSYFGIGKKNIAYSFCFFLLGGVIYLYREYIENIPIAICLIFAAMAVVLYFVGVMNCTVSYLMVSGGITGLAIAMDAKRYSFVLDNKLFSFISRISLEIYLSHMFIFRVVEKIGLNYCVENAYLQYALTCVLVILGTILFSIAAKKLIEMAFSKKSVLFGE